MFTEKQKDNWWKYEAVRQCGEINMWDALTGCRITGMNKDEWLFCIRNYNELKRQAVSGGERAGCNICENDGRPCTGTRLPSCFYKGEKK